MEQIILKEHRIELICDQLIITKRNLEIDSYRIVLFLELY